MSSMPLDPAVLLVTLAGLTFAGIIKGTTGIGYASCALPFLVWPLGLTTAMGLIVIPAMASNLVLLFTSGSPKETLQRFWPLYLGMLIGVPAGTHVLSGIDQAAAGRILGVVIVLFGLQALLTPKFRLPPRVADLLQMPVGLTNGFITGITGSQVIPVLPYLLALSLSSGQFVQVANMAIVLSSLLLALGMGWSGLMSGELLMYSLLAVVPALVGVSLGTWARSKIDPKRFRQIVVIVLMALGLLLLLR